VSLTLTYFPVRGRAEVIRVMLKDQGAEFDEKVITMEMWKESTLKASCVSNPLFGQLPILEDGDLTLYQTNAIRRHLARKLGLYGKDQREAALIDMMDEAIQDLLNKYIKLMFEKDVSVQMYGKCNQFDLNPYSKIILQQEDLISLADYALVILLIHHQVLSPPCLHAFPSLQSYLKRLCARPNLHAYFHSDDFKNRPIIPGKRT
uniref:Glutathione S-transferase P n=1 Tax=Oncorhynchus kisutch TaxID=8019 RepID=A0A8C7HP68_ONCKI